MSEDSESPTKVESVPANSTPATAPAAQNDETATDEDLLSLEDMDNLLAQDPEFSAHLAKIGPTSEMNINEEDWQLPETFADERNYWQRSGGWRRLANRFFPPLVFLGFLRRQARIRFRAFRTAAAEFAITIIPRSLKALKQGIGSLKETISEAMRSFSYFSWKKKLAIFGMLVLFVGSTFVVYRTLTKGLFPAPEELFVGSLQEWSQEDYTYNPETETENFYDSTHNTQNIMLLPKMVVNLRRSSGAGPNPMGAFEFYVEGTASDVLIEIKDREAEVRDLFQRGIEEMTFDQLSTPDGKQLLTEKLRKEVNKILSKGKVRRVFIKTILIKP